MNGGDMVEIKISGRGGQGAVLASQILASAFFGKGFYVQAFPSFGAERRGAPVSAFLRVDSKEITLRYSVQNPDWMVLFDPDLLKNPMVMAGTGETTSILINAARWQGTGIKACKSLFVVDATAISEGLNLKTTSFSIVNTAMVGAFAKCSNLLGIDRIVQAIEEMVPVKRAQNVAAAREAYEKVSHVAS
jgi:2-oxoacid:acceptor oxidoreductase gamma subunit (pyruvate/2-ketoisovalerate family)